MRIAITVGVIRELSWMLTAKLFCRWPNDPFSEYNWAQILSTETFTAERLLQSRLQKFYTERWKTVGVIFHLIDPTADLLVILKPDPIWPSLVLDSPSRKWTESVGQFSTETDTKTQSSRILVTMWWGGWRWSRAWRMWIRTSRTPLPSDPDPRKLSQSSSEVSLDLDLQSKESNVSFNLSRSGSALCQAKTNRSPISNSIFRAKATRVKSYLSNTKKWSSDEKLNLKGCLKILFTTRWKQLTGV